MLLKQPSALSPRQHRLEHRQSFEAGSRCHQALFLSFVVVVEARAVATFSRLSARCCLRTTSPDAMPSLWNQSTLTLATTKTDKSQSTKRNKLRRRRRPSPLRNMSVVANGVPTPSTDALFGTPRIVLEPPVPPEEIDIKFFTDEFMNDVADFE